MKRLGIALFLSLLFHLAQVGLVSVWPIDLSYQNETDLPIEFEVVETPVNEKNEKPIVKTVQNKQQAAINEPADFFSEETNRTTTQTRARDFGQFQSGHATNSNRLQQNSDANAVHPAFDPDGNQFRQQLNMPSQSEYRLPNDIQMGSATNLNTDAHIYGSFYNRVTDLFYIRWVQKLDSIWQRLSMETKLKLSGRVWSTEVEIWLDSSGKYQRGLVMKKSGFPPFDNAAIFAFQDAGFFPNPPRAKVESDGFIRLKYRINIHIR